MRKASQASREEGMLEALDTIAKGEGWEESGEHYAKKLGVKWDRFFK